MICGTDSHQIQSSNCPVVEISLGGGIGIRLGGKTDDFSLNYSVLLL